MKKPEKNKKNESNKSRRDILKTVAGGSALSLASLPGQWAKPIVASVVLPAHAQTSPSSPSGPCVGTIANCPSGYLVYDGTSGPATSTFTVSEVTKYPGISYSDGSLTGEYEFSTVISSGPCPEPCDVSGQLYGSYSLGFDGGSVSYGVVYGVRCGDEPVFRKYRNFEGTYSDGVDGTREYAGQLTYSVESCKYFFSETIEGTALIDEARQSLRQRRFRFGR